MTSLRKYARYTMLAMVGLVQVAQAGVPDEILDITESLLYGERAQDIPEQILATNVIPGFYQARDYQRAWKGPTEALEILKMLAESDQHGLNPSDYHYDNLHSIYLEWKQGRQLSDRQIARVDVLLTDGLLLYYRHLVEGKVEAGSMEDSWNFSRREFEPDQVIANLTAAIAKGTVRQQVEEVIPDLHFYNQLKASLAIYRGIAAEHVFEPIEETPTLRFGDQQPAVGALRRRLFELKFIDTDTGSSLFDEELKQGVSQYQNMHGLDADGIVGSNSWKKLNVPYEQRVQQLRINMDRVRWIRQDFSDDLIVVNIAGFELYYLVDHQLNWKSQVMTGKVSTQTPMFYSRISYLVMNPTWTVPRSIIRRSLFKKFSADPNYVNSNNYHLYDSDGKRVDPLQLDWSQYSAGRFPFRVVQQPGPGNALGTIKFMFPNKHAIYLHDTPSRQLFSRTARAFSSGCIRVQDPLELAHILLDDEEKWSMEVLESRIEGGKLENVRLPKKVDIALMYWTSGPTFDEDGRVAFFPDIYSRDAAVAKALDAPAVWNQF